MRVCACPSCGTVIRDNPLWRGSRFDFNADYMNFFDEAPTVPELFGVIKTLAFAKNFEPFVVGPVIYYRRGKGGKYLYRVPNEDCRVDVEKRKAHTKGKQIKLTSISEN